MHVVSKERSLVKGGEGPNDQTGFPDNSFLFE